MKLQKHISKKKGKKNYHKYVIVLPDHVVKKAGFRKGQNLDVEVGEGVIKIKKQ